jgi:DNA-directed RNA polymerase subunit RPC12/RpoP
MPLYLYTCPKCEATRSDMRTIDERKDGPRCDRDGSKMVLTLAPVIGIVKNPAVPKS